MKTENQIITAILSELDFELESLVARRVARYEEAQERSAPAWLAQHIRMELILDMCKAIEKHTLSSDVLEHLSSARHNKGSLTISATVRRDGALYSLHTDAIYAGGWNIQRLHIRYITRTDLPKSFSLMPVSARVKSIISLQKKQAKMEQELRLEQIYLATALKQSLHCTKSDDELAQQWLEENSDHARILLGSWEDLNEFGKANFQTEEAYLVNMAEWLMENVVRRRTTANRMQMAARRHQAQITKIHAKQQKLEQHLAMILEG